MALAGGGPQATRAEKKKEKSVVFFIQIKKIFENKMVFKNVFNKVCLHQMASSNDKSILEQESFNGFYIMVSFDDAI